MALVLAIALGAVGVVRGTWAVGGSDSSCYALMAKAFAAGDLQPASALATDAPWPNASRTLAPGGFIPSPVRPDAASPICAPGMSVLMAPLAAVFGRDAIFWLTPIAAAALVLFAFAIGRQLAGGVAGVTAAILTATSPIVLYQTVQPMNDILTAALWLRRDRAGAQERDRRRADRRGDPRASEPRAARDRARADSVHPVRHQPAGEYARCCR